MESDSILSIVLRQSHSYPIYKLENFVARIYTSFTKPREAEEALTLLATMGYMVIKPERLEVDTVGSRGEFLICADTEQMLVGSAERYVFKGSRWVNSSWHFLQEATKAASIFAQGDLK